MNGAHPLHPGQSWRDLRLDTTGPHGLGEMEDLMADCFERLIESGDQFDGHVYADMVIEATDFDDDSVWRLTEMARARWNGPGTNLPDKAWDNTVPRPFATLRSLIYGHRSNSVSYAGVAGLQILCGRRGGIVRKLVVDDITRVVDCDAITEVLGIPIATPLHYQPWVMDRGSILLWDPTPGSPRGKLKLCTESDVLLFEDGTRREVTVRQ